ncbi:hypothetical protein JTE90_011025 [Oedothorax gibbosus]|uniref:Uncharacterized protein n=1 Tax=Oedothorax gibbosus TaxID=931172 RepID=A0AAV6VCM1_9ARAC|nr:hypothetical protein JTE90_011025 [Oedothorax gibbosus]
MNITANLNDSDKKSGTHPLTHVATIGRPPPDHAHTHSLPNDLGGNTPVYTPTQPHPSKGQIAETSYLVHG